MDSDDEIMFCQLMGDEAAFAYDGENEMVMANLTRINKRVEGVSVEAAERKHGGSTKGRRANKNHQRATGHRLLWDEYFSDTLANLTHEFRLCFRMNREVFRRNVHSVRDYDDYFELKKDCTGLLGFSSIWKCTAAIRCLVYVCSAEESICVLCAF